MGIDVPGIVALTCARCGSRLVRILAPWGRGRDVGTRAFRCPRLAACGYGGVLEDAGAARRHRAGLPEGSQPLVSVSS